MQSKIEMESAIEAVESVGLKIKTAKTLDEAIEILEQTLKTARASLAEESNAPIEFEQVTIKVPKPIMEFLRKTDVDNEGPESWIEWQVVDGVRAYLECEHTEEWIAVFKLGPIFRNLLGDKNYS